MIIQETATPAVFTLLVSQPTGVPQTSVLHVTGVLDHLSYEVFIDRAAALHRLGNRRLIIDLRQTTRIELSGLFALHSIARLYGGERLLDPEVGWMALQAATGHMTTAMQAHIKLLAPSPAVARAIQHTSFSRFLEIYTDLPAVLAAFSTKRERAHA